jgi:hypothetical protein
MLEAAITTASGINLDVNSFIQIISFLCRESAHYYSWTLIV